MCDNKRLDFKQLQFAFIIILALNSNIHGKNYQVILEPHISASGNVSIIQSEDTIIRNTNILPRITHLGTLWWIHNPLHN